MSDITRYLKRAIPKVGKNFIKRRLLHWNYYCPICETWLKCYQDYVFVEPWHDQKCPRCGSLARHRAAWLLFISTTDLLNSRPKRILHIAPESCLERKLRALPHVEYLSGDLDGRNAMAMLDITSMDFGDAVFDVICCSHVLEHVRDDRRAMTEFYRVLKPGGWALVVVPISGDQTFEDPAVTDSAERLRLFGQEDHVRTYGFDVQERLSEAGFSVSRFTFSDVSAGMSECYGLHEDSLFLCAKSLKID